MPRKATTQPELPDPVVFGPAAPPPSSPSPPKPRRRRKGPVESALAADLARLPDELSKGAIAASLTRLAIELDTGMVMGRDAAGHSREIRLGMLTLNELAPPGEQGDQTDEVRAQRERRLAARAATE